MEVISNISRRKGLQVLIVFMKSQKPVLSLCTASSSQDVQNSCTQPHWAKKGVTRSTPAPGHWGTLLPDYPRWHLCHLPARLSRMAHAAPHAMLFWVAQTALCAMPCSAGCLPWHPGEAGDASRALSPGCPQGGWRPWGGAALTESPSALAVPPPFGPQQQWLCFCCLCPARAGPGDICKVQSSQHNSLGKCASNCK